MNPRTALIASLLALAGATTAQRADLGRLLDSTGAATARQTGVDDLVVHEWGTFLAMSGSDGVTLDGMYHEEHALPAFVHSRSRDQLHLTSADIKGETPVIYFYSRRPAHVDVRVEFLQGIWTQWYPQARHVGPTLSAAGSPPQLRGGHIEWSLDVRPPNRRLSLAGLPATERGALWNCARAVDSDDVSTRSQEGATEAERFVFYRGLGEAPLPVRASPADGGTVRLDSGFTGSVRDLFAIRVENGRGAFAYRPELRAGQSMTGALPSMESARPLAEFVPTVSRALEARLIAAGLYPQEAAAMTATWRRSYFESDGVRLLFVLPRSWTDGFIPLQIDPTPTSLVRVMVGRIEMLTPDRERRAASAIARLGSPDRTEREKAFNELLDEGRYVEPIVRRVMRANADPRVQDLCRRLLYTGFVSELRSSARSAVNGEKVTEDPNDVRAQLASLLREVGLNDEARQEGDAVVSALRGMPQPPMNDHLARKYLRSYARAMEGVGDVRGAAEWYGRLVEFGGGAKRCGGCHLPEGPKNMAWFRDWWAGRKFAAYASMAGLRDRIVAEQEARLKISPGDTASQMKLAYLYESVGHIATANRLWAAVEAKPGREAVSRALSVRPLLPGR